jgi:hypothetical protein
MNENIRPIQDDILPKQGEIDPETEPLSKIQERFERYDPALVESEIQRYTRLKELRDTPLDAKEGNLLDAEFTQDALKEAQDEETGDFLIPKRQES